MTLSDDLAKATSDARALEAALAAATADDASDQQLLDAALARVADLERQLAECQAGDDFLVGVSPGRWLNFTPDDQQRQLDSMRSCGIGALRFAPEWAGLEPRAGEFKFDRLVEVCERAEATEFDVTICPTYPPVHARVTPSERFSAPKVASVRAMARALGVATAHLRSRKREWTNEPNLLYWVPPDPVAYSKTLDAFSTELLRGDPAAQVVSAGLAPGKQNPPRSWHPARFIEAMYANAKVCAPGAPVKLAGVGFHPYMGGSPPDTIATWATMGPIWDDIVATIESRPGPHPPIESTEWGYSTGNPEANGTTEALQARYIVEQLEMFRARRPVAGVPYLHRWIDFRPGEYAGMTAYNEQLGVHWSAATVAEALAKPKAAVAAIREYLVG